MTDVSLEEVPDRYRQAVGARDATRLPLARSVRYTENGQPIPLTAGVWPTATAAPARYFDVLDEVNGQAVLIGVLPEGSERFLFSTRIRVVHGEVTEVETLIVTRRSPFSIRGLENLSGPRTELDRVVPTRRRSSRERLAEIAHLYFDGVQTDDGSIIPAAAGCTRRENGTQTVPLDEALAETLRGEWGLPDRGDLGVADHISTGMFRYISAIDNRRIVAIDEARQIVAGCVIFQHRGEVTSMPELGMETLPEVMRLPSSMLTVELFKVDAGEIVAIEAVGVFCPLGTTAGWPIDPVRPTRFAGLDVA